MTEAQIKHLRDRFLGWSLPESFNPDGGIAFERASFEGKPYPMPSGTNLLHAGQADAMVRHMVDGMPASPKDEYAWLIEAPGPHYLGARETGGWQFFWTRDHDKAIRFHSQQQADAVMMAVRALNASLFDFALMLTDAKAVEHGWMAAA